MKVVRLVAFALVSVAMLLLAGCGSSRAPRGMLPLGSDLISPAAVVNLGGFDFAANSYRIQHPYFVGNEFTPPLNFIGFGPGEAGGAETHVYEDGGQVQGVHCLLYSMAERDQNGDVVGSVKVWAAQDTRGNVQILKLQEEEMTSPELVGVAAGQGPARLLRDDVSAGKAWWLIPGQAKCRSMGEGQSFGPRNDLLRVMVCFDDNEDGVFQFAWNSPDEREDWYFAPNDGWLAQVYDHTTQGIAGIRRRTLVGPQGVTFSANSANIVHPFFVANPATAEKRLRGYGTYNGRWQRYRFSDGGQVNGIATVKMTTLEGDAGSGADDISHLWLAQDTQGNVHFLKRSEEGEAFLIGVGAGRAPAWFLPADPTAQPWASGRPWFTFGGMIKMRVLQINASKHGRNDLLKLQLITDDNNDLRFDGRFNGLDDRDDYYLAPNDGPWFQVSNDEGEVNGWARVQ